MPILTGPSTKWRITLSSTTEQAIESLQQSDIKLPPVGADANSVTAITGTGLIRDITLQRAVSNLIITGITRNGDNYGLSVVSVEDIALVPYYDQIRMLLNVDLDADTLPDNKIRSPFLRSAEIEIYEDIGRTEQQYDDQIGDVNTNDARSKAEKARLATLYRTAGLMVTSVPDIIEGAALSERTRYVEFDPLQKRDELIKFSKDLISDLIPTNGRPVTGSGVPIGTMRRCPRPRF